MISDFFEGIHTYRKAVGMISKHGLWSYVIMPGLLSLMLGIVLVSLGFAYAGEMGNALGSFYPEDWIGAGIIGSILGILSFILILGTCIFFFKYLVMILSAPFMGPLSEKIEALVNGRSSAPFSLKNTLVDLIRGIRISLRNASREILITLFLLLLNFVPVVGNIAAAVLIFMVQSYFAGFGNMDPTLERHRLKVSQRVSFVRRYRSLAAGNGTLFLLLLMIPVLGWFLAPAYGTIAGTLSTLKRLEGVSVSAS